MTPTATGSTVPRQHSHRVQPQTCPCCIFCCFCRLPDAVCNCVSGSSIGIVLFSNKYYSQFTAITLAINLCKRHYLLIISFAIQLGIEITSYLTWFTLNWMLNFNTEFWYLKFCVCVFVCVQMFRVCAQLVTLELETSVMGPSPVFLPQTATSPCFTRLVLTGPAFRFWSICPTSRHNNSVFLLFYMCHSSWN